MTQLVRKELILAKVESSYNVDAAPTGAADAVMVSDPSWQHEDARMIERRLLNSTLGPEQSIYAGTLTGVKFDVELKGSGAAGTPPDLGVLLRGCACGETIVPSTSVTYAPVSTNHESLTLWYYQDGSVKKITGARGNVTMSLEAGKVGKLSFSFVGHAGPSTDLAMITGTYDGTDPVALIGITGFLAQNYAAKINTLNFDMANELSKPTDITASDGFGEIRIADFDPQGSFDPEKVLVATQDFETKYRAGTSAILTTGVVGAVAGNRFNFTVPLAYYREIGPGDREGIRTYDISYGCAKNTGDDQFSLAFT